MNNKDFLYINKYLNSFNFLVEDIKKNISKILLIKELITEAKKKNKKILIFGNGGSAAIASHFSIDLTKCGNIRCINFNESSLITCFSNDFGYENWVAKAVEYYANSGDVLILISSSGESLNMINACKAAKKYKIKKTITFTGFSEKNSLKRSGEINIWVNSKIYNHVENIHQIMLLSIIDLINKTNIS